MSEIITSSSANTLIGDRTGQNVSVINTAGAAAEDVTLNAYGTDAEHPGTVTVTGEKGSTFSGTTRIAAGYDAAGTASTYDTNNSAGQVKLGETADSVNKFTGDLKIKALKIINTKGKVILEDVAAQFGSSVCGSGSEKYEIGGTTGISKLGGGDFTFNETGAVTLKDGVKLSGDGTGVTAIGNAVFEKAAEGVTASFDRKINIAAVPGYLSVKDVTLQNGAGLTVTGGDTDTTHNAVEIAAGGTLAVTGTNTELKIDNTTEKQVSNAVYNQGRLTVSDNAGLIATGVENDSSTGKIWNTAKGTMEFSKATVTAYGGLLTYGIMNVTDSNLTVTYGRAVFSTAGGVTGKTTWSGTNTVDAANSAWAGFAHVENNGEMTIVSGKTTITAGSGTYNGGILTVTENAALAVDQKLDNAGTVNVSGTLTAGNDIETRVSDDAAGAGVLNVTGGKLISTSGDIIISTGAAAVLSGDNTLSARKIMNSGTMTINAGTTAIKASSTDALVNSGTINLKGGAVDGKIISSGTVNWVLDNSEYTATSLDWTKLTNSGTLVITVDADAAAGESCTLATGASGAADSFTLTGIAGLDDATITVGGIAAYNSWLYRLAEEEGSLKLTAVSHAAPVVEVTTEEKWFRKGETVTVTGTIVSGDLASFTVKAGKAEAAAVAFTKREGANIYDWSYTYTGMDTRETKLTFTAVDGSAVPLTGTAEYLLKVDTVAPGINITRSSEGYVVGTGAAAVHWYKRDALVTVSATAEDATSGVAGMTYENQSYNAGETEFLDTRAEMLSPHTVQFSATDNAGNRKQEDFLIDVDGTGPEIDEVVISSFSGDTKYVDGNGSVWFRKGDTTAELTVGITDAKSGLKEAFYGTSGYADGKFVLSTESGLNCCIEAYDNVENVSRSEVISYCVDGDAPSITVTHVPSEKFTTSVDVTAVITDGGSGVKTQQYSFDQKAWYDYTGTFTISESCDLYFRAVDNVGNSATVIHTITNVDTVPPEVTVDPLTDTVTLKEEVVFSVNATDSYTNVTGLEYRSTVDGTTWTDWTQCTIAQGQKSVDVSMTADVNNTTYQFRAYDQAGNVSRNAAITFNNIYKGTETGYTITGVKTVTADLALKTQTVTMTENSTLNVEEKAVVAVDTLAMNGNATLVNAGGTVIVKTLNVSGKYVAEEGTYNSIWGNSITADYITVAADAVFGMSKDQYDSFMTSSTFTADSGKLMVHESAGNALRTSDIDTLLNKNNVSDVDFAGQALIELNKLEFKKTKAVKIGFKEAYGTRKNDSIIFRKDTDVILGAEDGGINLEEGSNTVQADKNARAVILSRLSNVSSIKTVNGSSVTLADVDFAAGRNGTLRTDDSDFKAGSINGTDRSTTITIGRNTHFVSGSIAFADKADKITSAKDSYVEIGSIEEDEAGMTNFTGADLNFNGGNDMLDAKGAFFATGSICFGDGSDKLSIGQETSFLAAENWTCTLEDPAAGTGIRANIDFGSGNDSLSVGRNAAFVAGSIIKADTVKLENSSRTDVGSIEGTKKLTVSNGRSSSEGEFAALHASEVTGTDANDNFSFGNYCYADLKSLDFGDGNDVLKTGNNAEIRLGSLTFGSGSSDSLTIGKDSTVSVDKLDVNSLEKLSMSKGAVLVLSDAEEYKAARDKWSKYSEQIKLA